jgi:hypothetical protein
MLVVVRKESLDFIEKTRIEVPQGLHVRVYMGVRRDAHKAIVAHPGLALLLLLGLNRTNEPDTDRASHRTESSSRTRRSSGSPSSAFVEGMNPKSNGKLPCGSPALSRNVPRSKSNAYLFRLPWGLDHGKNVPRLGVLNRLEKFPPADFRIELLL